MRSSTSAAAGPARLVALALLGVLLAAGPAAAAGPVRIVILPIVVHSADPDAAYVSEGISDMLASRLEQTGRIEVDVVSEPEAATTRVGEALRSGQKLHGDYVLFGAFTQFGDGASLDVHCIPVDVKDEAEAAAARRIFVQSGAMGDIIPKLDEIVDRVTVYTHVAPAARTAAGPAAAPPAAAPAPPAGADAATLRDLTQRLEALEEAVFGADASKAATTKGTEPAPES